MLAGQIRPLGEILRQVQPRLGGEVIRLNLEREDGRWVYEFTVLEPGGRIVEWYVDAATAQILKHEAQRAPKRR